MPGYRPNRLLYVGLLLTFLGLLATRIPALGALAWTMLAAGCLIAVVYLVLTVSPPKR